MNLIIIIGIALILLIVYLIIDWVAGVYIIFLEKQVKGAMDLMKREEEYKEYKKKTVTLVDLRNYFDLVEKMTGKPPKVIKMTEYNFEKYKSYLDPYLRLIKYDDNYTYREIPIEVIKDDKKI